MAIDLNALLGQIGRDKGIDKRLLIEAVESAMLSAARKHYGHNLNLEAQYDEESGTIEVLQFKTVVDRVEDPGLEILIDDAREKYDPEAMIGDEFGEKLDTNVLGRIAAQTAKQVIIQKVRDAERGVIFEEFKNSKGELINGIVQRYDRGNVLVNLGRTEAILPKREQILKERYRQGDRVRAIIIDIDRSARGPQIVLSRSHPDLLRRLFELEVPEISEGVIELKGVAREPGERAKIAVYSSDSNIDPVGACVGVKGSRVHAVVQELRGEKIDIIPWTPDEPSFVARALSPAEVARVVLDEDEHSMEVIVADDQLSYAIGRNGQNVKLASRLTGWKIDVRSVSVAEEEAKRVRAALEAIPGIQFTHAEQLYQEGYGSAAEVAETSVEDLMEIEGISQTVAEDIIEKAKQHVAAIRESGGSTDLEETVVTDLDKLFISSDLKAKLLAGGYSTIQSVAIASDDDLFCIDSFDVDDLEMVKSAIATFFNTQAPLGDKDAGE
ncbi:MAG: transcription termination factor NusA [Bdellovibrionota bacterium]|jgi:N utilization substance protein A